MNKIFMTELLYDPTAWIIVTLVLIFGFYSLFAIWSNAGSLLPNLSRNA